MPSNPRSRGARWRRWDLHVHTPFSVVQHYGDSNQTSTWDEYISALEELPSDISVLGITDYFTIDGYRRLREERQNGRLQNIELLLPIIELRIDHFAGNSSLQKLNLHVLFSEDVPPEDIQSFFLDRLRVEHHLVDGKPPWNGVLGSRDSLTRFGEAIIDSTPPEKRSGDSALRVGFANAAIPAKLIWELLGDSIFKNRYLTGLGVGEWSQMRWEGSGTVQKRDSIGRVDFVLTAADSLDSYQQQRLQLERAKVNTRLIDASDSHHFASSSQPDKLGATLTWIKADPSFAGLRRALRRFDGRVHVGAAPEKLARVQQNRGKYIRAIEIRPKAKITTDEKWFDVYVPLNTDLVAIIGNQGGGKSALTDAIALCAGVPSHGFSFLTTEKFCDKEKKAASFEATIWWEDGHSDRKSLDDTSSPMASPRVQYVPQGFFERLTNEKRVVEDGHFYQEIQKAIFSHIPNEDRIGCSDLRTWMDKRGEALRSRLAMMRQEMGELNLKIVSLEDECGNAAAARIEQAIKDQETAIRSLREEKPQAVPPPMVSSSDQQRLDDLRVKELTIAKELASLRETKTQLNERVLALATARTALGTVKAIADSSISKIVTSLRAAGIALNASQLVTIQLNLNPLTAIEEKTRAEMDSVELKLGMDETMGLRGEKQRCERERAEIQSRQVDATRAYEDYKNALESWEQHLRKLEGDQSSPSDESLRGLQLRLRQIKVDKPKALLELRASRRELATEILGFLHRLREVFVEATEPVKRHIDNHRLTKELYHLGFEVQLQPLAFSERFFGFVLQSQGSFTGQQASVDLVQSILEKHDLASLDGPVAFADEILSLLGSNIHTNPRRPTDPVSLLRKGYTLDNLYDYLFGFEYLVPSLALSLNGKPLRQLSPGERGILLLVFYLVVDCNDVPLIIDQPEGNLNNQSIFQHLVPIFTAAKEQRQVIIVTHNPNLAVVCDAEQIVHCSINIADGNRVEYETGPLEDRRFNEFSLDLLDGTSAAFESRRITYADGGGI
jgi:predicted ATPase